MPPLTMIGRVCRKIKRTMNYRKKKFVRIDELESKSVDILTFSNRNSVKHLIRMCF